ncbi:MAG: hypothetical protein WDN28_26180 [Chthoniobacter sp.]
MPTGVLPLSVRGQRRRPHPSLPPPVIPDCLGVNIHFQPDGPKIDWKGWRYVTFPMQPTAEKPFAHRGGADDGTIHYPIQWDAIFLLDNVSRQPVEGEIYLSAPTLLY